MQIANGSMNIKCIPEDKIKTKDKNGNTFRNGAMYVDFTILIYDKPDEHGNNVKLIVSQTKEERKSQAEKIYFANAKVVWSSEKQEPKEEPFQVKDKDSSLPF